MFENVKDSTRVGYYENFTDYPLSIHGFQYANGF